MHARGRRLVGTAIIAVGAWVGGALLAYTPLAPLSGAFAWGVLGGPLFVLALWPLAKEDERAWVRRLGTTVASLSPTLFLAILASGLANGHTRDPAMLFLGAVALAHAVLLVRARRGLSRTILILGVALAILPFTRDLIAVVFLVAQAVAFFALTRFRRSFDVWAKAAAGGAVTIVAGLGILIMVRGTVFPPKLTLDEKGFELLVLPIAVASALVFAILLAQGREAKSLPSRS